MSQTHTVRGQLHDVDFAVHGGLPSITLTLLQTGRYTSHSIRCIRSYQAHEGELARRHYLRLTEQVDQQVHCDGAALVHLPKGITLLGVQRISALINPPPVCSGFAPTQPMVHALDRSRMQEGAC